MSRLAPDPATPAAPRADEERVAILSGDRLCIECGYNLTGQSIVREPHHRLLIVRCPECGAVTSVQEYPLLGRWATRWGVILATLWFILVVAAWPFSALIIFGFTVQTAEQGSRRYGSEIRDLHRAARTQTAPPGSLSLPAGVPPSFTATGDFDAWWIAQDTDALLADAGGWFEAVDWRALWIWLPAGLISFALGLFWSMVLLHLRRPALLLWGAAVLALASVFVSVAFFDWTTTEQVRSWNAGRGQIGPPLLAMTWGWCALALGAGLLLGRSGTRLMVRVLLSPRFRAPLAVIWTADGLAPPTTRGRAGSG